MGKNTSDTLRLPKNRTLPPLEVWRKCSWNTWKGSAVLSGVYLCAEGSAARETLNLCLLNSRPCPPSHIFTIPLYLLDLEENNSLRPGSKHLSEFIETTSRKSSPAGNLTWNTYKLHVVREEGTWVLSMFSSASSPLKQSSCFSLPRNCNYRHLQLHQNEGQM